MKKTKNQVYLLKKKKTSVIDVLPVFSTNDFDLMSHFTNIITFILQNDKEASWT